VKQEINIKPFAFRINLKDETIPEHDNHIVRKLSAMKGQYFDNNAFNQILQKNDCILYEVYEKLAPALEGNLIQGISIVHSGKVGKEYFMTKGHFHSILNSAELYYCLKGQGYMLMETPEGIWQAEKLEPGSAVYVPGNWAHRSINIHDKIDLVTLFCYPANAGHDYATIETKGFRKLVVKEKGKPEIIDNPRWN
jgi:glucose-6-phosphate isomerase, archaeal